MQPHGIFKICINNHYEKIRLITNFDADNGGGGGSDVEERDGS